MDKVRLHIPKWAGKVYIVLSLILLPWTIYLMISLPTRRITHHYDISWAGFDIAMLAGLLATAIFGYIHSKWIIISATIVATMMLTDAWFDILSERPGAGMTRALVMAFFVEIPLALLSYGIAWRVIAKHVT
jgi:hypothetical protein